MNCYPADLDSNLDQSTEFYLHRIILQNNVQSTFFNAEIALRIFLSLTVTSRSGKKSFSQLKLVKNKLRTSIGQNRLINLLLLNTEYDMLRN